MASQRPTPLAKTKPEQSPVGRLVTGAKRVYLVTEDELEDRVDPEKEAADKAAVLERANALAAEEKAAAHRALDESIERSPLWAKKPGKPAELVVQNDAELAVIANLRIGICQQNAAYISKFSKDLARRVKKQ